MIRASVRALLAVSATVGFAGTASATGPLPTEWQVGGIALVVPKYEGSKEYRALGFPLAIPAGLDDGRSRFSFKGVDDIRFRLLEQYGFELGPIAGWRFGRDEKDGNKLTGLGDIDGGLVVGGYLGYRFGSALASVSYGHQVTGDDNGGGLLRFGLENRFRPAQGWTLTGTVSTTWADSDYMATYFGVPASKAIAGRPAFDPDAGFKDVSLTLANDFELDRNWTLKLIGRYSRLVGDAADSPVVETANQFYGGVGLTYRFDFGSGRR